MLDHHKVPKANSVDEVRSSESSTAGDPAPAGQVKPTVEHKPRTSKEAKPDPGDQQVFKNQVPREAEIHDLEKVMKSQPLAKASSKPHLIQALPLPISVERHASAGAPRKFRGSQGGI